MEYMTFTAGSVVILVMVAALIIFIIVSLIDIFRKRWRAKRSRK